jgi:ATP-dependent Clp protease ATP-binding subunit ClpA
MLRHNYIGTEHILLGIIHEGEASAARALRSLDIDLDALGRDIKALVGHGSGSSSAHIPFTPRAKKTLELALRESLQLRCDYIGTEHILLGLIREGEGPAAQVLIASGATLERVRHEVIALFGETGGEGRAGNGGEVHATGVSLEDIAIQLRSIGRRLAAIEAKLGIEDSPASERLRRIELALTRIRGEMESAVDAQDHESAAELLRTEKKLRAAHREAEQAWLAEAGEATATRPHDATGDNPPDAASA